MWWSRLFILFWAKKNTSCFVAIKSDFVFSSIVTTNIQKTLQPRGGSTGGDWGDRPPKTYQSDLVHQDFVQLGKQHSWQRVISLSIVLSQQFCEAYFISLIVAKLLWDLISKYAPPKVTGWIRSCCSLLILGLNTHILSANIKGFTTTFSTMHPTVDDLE